MFSDSSEAKTVEVYVSLTEGQELQGSLACGLVPSISAALNGDGQFVELVDASGHSVFIAKHQIARLEPLKKGGKAMPALRAAATEKLRWHEVLGVAPSAGPDAVKAAYHALVKQYHPDLYADHMPSEMRLYASEMLTAINKAYDAYQQVQVAA